MRRLSRNLLGAALVFLGSVALAQTPPATPPASAPAAGKDAAPTSDLYPLKAGSKWTYKVGDATTIEMKVEKIDAGEATIATAVNSKTVANESVKVTADGVYRTKINGTAVNPPVKFLALPAKKDTKWDVNSKITVTGTEHAIKGTFTSKEEKIKIKDKEYDTIVSDGPDFDIAGTKASVKYWFVAGKGIVKLSYNIGGNEAILELAE